MITQLETTLLTHFQAQLATHISSDLTSSRVVFSLVEDETDHRRVLDRAAKDVDRNSGVQLPSAVIVRVQLSPDENFNYSRATNRVDNVIVTRDESSATITKAVLAEISYRLVLYDNKFTTLNAMLLNWFAQAGESMTYFQVTTPDLGDEHFDATITFDPPEGVKPGRVEMETSQGQIYSQGFPFRLNTILLLPTTTHGVILTTPHNIFTNLPD